MNEQQIALLVDELDNVATIFATDIRSGTTVEVLDKRGKSRKVTVTSDVPYGHKIAVTSIPKGAHIIKYGESIGAASVDIAPGAYVHIHNLEALRGRGDKQEDI